MAKTPNRAAHGAARHAMPQNSNEFQTEGHHVGHADYAPGKGAGVSALGSQGDYQGIHDEDLTMHQMHEADEDGAMHPGWTDFGVRMNLEAPPPRAGFEQRWVRCEFRDGQDALNLNKRFRDGWQPRDPATVPKQMHFFPVMKHSSGPNCIYVDGMMLCERPVKLGDRFRQAVRAAGDRMKAGIRENIVKESADGMRRGMPPILMEERRNVTLGKSPKVMDDDN